MAVKQTEEFIREQDAFKYCDDVETPFEFTTSMTYLILNKLAEGLSQAIEASNLANQSEDKSKSKYWFLCGQIDAFTAVRSTITKYIEETKESYYTEETKMDKGASPKNEVPQEEQ